MVSFVKYFSPFSVPALTSKVLLQHGLLETRTMSVRPDIVFLRAYTPPSKYFCKDKADLFTSNTSVDLSVINHYYAATVSEIPILVIGEQAKLVHRLNGGEVARATNPVKTGVVYGNDLYPKEFRTALDLPVLNDLCYDYEILCSKRETFQGWLCPERRQLAFCFSAENNQATLPLFTNLLEKFKKEVL